MTVVHQVPTGLVQKVVHHATVTVSEHWTISATSTPEGASAGTIPTAGPAASASQDFGTSLGVNGANVTDIQKAASQVLDSVSNVETLLPVITAIGVSNLIMEILGLELIFLADLVLVQVNKN